MRQRHRHRHRHRPTLRRLLARAVLTTLAMTTGGGLVVIGSAGVADVPGLVTAHPRVERAEPSPPAPVARLMRRYDCSTTGLAPDAVPRSAIVRRPTGALQVVSFEQGWAVYTGADASGTVLVAVCLRPVR